MAEISDIGSAQRPSATPSCKRCGIRSFYRGSLAELGGDFVAVNANCLD